MRLLFCHYQIGKDGIPNDEERLARMCGMDVRQWRRVEGQVRGFFVWDAHAGTKKRVIDTLLSIEEKSAKARANALKRTETTSADAQPPLSVGSANHKPITINHASTNVEVPPNPQGGTERFEDFWKLYPQGKRKVDRSRCEKAWRAAKLDEQADTVLGGLTWWVNSTDWKKENGRFICAPLVFLNQRRWEAVANLASTARTWEPAPF